MNDLTVVYYTANHVTPAWEAFVTSQLLRSIGDDFPLISVSQKPMDGFGRNLCVGDIGRSHLNIYRQMLVGAKAADTTYLAFTEDDILYPPEHFTYRPSRLDVAAYDMHKWALYTWVRPACYNTSSYRRTTGCIISRQMFIDAMEERFALHERDEDYNLSHFTEVGRHERQLGVAVRDSEEFAPETPHVVVFHERALGFAHLGMRKRVGAERIPELPYWGRAEDLLRRYYE